MTNTPRTQAELLAIFADGQQQGISAQDMRDFVVSVFPTTTDSFAFVTVAISLPIATLPAAANTSSFGLPTPLTLATARRTVSSTLPADWFDSAYTLDGSDPTNSWGITWPTDSAMMLPTGTYSYQFAVYWSPTGIAPSGLLCPVFGLIDQAEYDPDFSQPVDRSQPFVYPGYYNGGGMSTMSTFTSGDHSLAYVQTTAGVLVNDEAEPKPFVTLAYTQGYTSSVAVSATQFQIVKVA